jgi:hypothetical protein
MEAGAIEIRKNIEFASRAGGTVQRLKLAGRLP